MTAPGLRFVGGIAGKHQKPANPSPMHQDLPHAPSAPAQLIQGQLQLRLSLLFGSGQVWNDAATFPIPAHIPPTSPVAQQDASHPPQPHQLGWPWSPMVLQGRDIAASQAQDCVYLGAAILNPVSKDVNPRQL